MTVLDTQLVESAACPLGVFANTVNPQETCAIDLLQWCTLETFNGRIIPLDTLRKKFVHHWNAHWSTSDHAAHPQYWEGVRFARSYAVRLWNLFDKYEVLRPFQPYDLMVGNHHITGTYAVIGRRHPDSRTPEGPSVLVTHTSRPKICVYPHLASLAKWKHAMMTGEYLQLGIYHFPLLRGSAWRNKQIPQERLVEHWLRGILGVMNHALTFPSPSGACAFCTTHACLEVFRD